jgi:hypothetical protein
VIPSRDPVVAPAVEWLPPGKRAGIVFTIDDVHPGKSTDVYEAGGDLGQGALGHVEWLLERHPELWVTLFVTPDWREIRPAPNRRVLRRVPWLRDRTYLTRIRPVGTMRLDRHPAFVRYIKDLPRTDIAVHGLHHVHTGRSVVVEFQKQSADQCEAILVEALGVFASAGIGVARGMAPPGWGLTDGLGDAMVRLGFLFVAAARDLVTPISAAATTAMSGPGGLSLIQPQLVLGNRLVHFSTNFQATSDLARAVAIVEAGGLLAIKAHIIKEALGYIQADGLDVLYRNYLDLVLTHLEDRYGSSLWWTSMGEIASRMTDQNPFFGKQEDCWV